MGQRTLHYAFGTALAESCGIGDRDRFLLGSVLPDAFASQEYRNDSHYRTSLPDGRRYYDFDRFREDFSAQIKEDALYQGYYMHLVEDCFYRQYCYVQHRILIKNDADVRQLHRDYHLLNAYLVQKRKLRFTLRHPDDFSQEPICRAASFDLESFLREMRDDFSDRPDGRTHFITEALIDGFFDRYLPAAERELQALLSGRHGLRAVDLSWFPQN